MQLDSFFIAICSFLDKIQTAVKVLLFLKHKKFHSVVKNLTTPPGAIKLYSPHKCQNFTNDHTLFPIHTRP